MKTISEKSAFEMRFRFYTFLFLLVTFTVSHLIIKFYGITYPPCPPCTICPHSSGWQATLEGVRLVSAVVGIMSGLIALIIWLKKYEMEHEEE